MKRPEAAHVKYIHGQLNGLEKIITRMSQHKQDKKLTQESKHNPSK